MVGLVYLAAYLREKGHDISITDATFLGLDSDSLKEEIKHSQAQVFGITAMTHEIPKAREIFRWIKHFNKSQPRLTFLKSSIYSNRFCGFLSLKTVTILA